MKRFSVLKKCKEEASEEDVTHHVQHLLKTFSCCRSGNEKPDAIVSHQ